MMIANVVQPVTKATDLKRLKEIVIGIIGEICWKAILSYGDELSLHIGARIPYSQKSMAGKEKGAWILGTRATKWRLESSNEVIITSEDELEIIRKKVRAIENNTITGFDVSYPDLSLTVTFSNRYKLILTPDADDSDLPYWELFTPNRMILKVGAGDVWSYSHS